MELLEAFKKYHNANHHDGENHFDDEIYKMSNGGDFDSEYVQECFDHFEAAWQEQQKRIDAVLKHIEREEWSDEYGDNQCPTQVIKGLLK